MILFMNIMFEELRRIKHSLPTGSIARIARELNIDEQTVRNYFGAHNYSDGQLVEFHLEPGPGGGVVHLEDDTIYNLAMQILKSPDPPIRTALKEPFVKVPVAEYQKMIGFIEDYGLGLAMKSVENESRLSRKDALILLEADES